MTDPEGNRDFLASNYKMITAALSMVPGAGHMYLGYLREGTLLMAVFFFTVFLLKKRVAAGVKYLCFFLLSS